MANEAVIITLLGNGGDPVRYTVDDTQAIPKGTLLRLVDARKVSGAALNGQPAAGIAAAEKVANDGSTNIAVYTNGIFDLTASTEAITAGEWVTMSGANLVRVATTGEVISGAAFGKALETASANEVIAVKVMC